MMKEKELKEQYFLLMQDMEMWNEAYREKNFYPLSEARKKKLKGLDYSDGVPYWDAMENARNKAFGDRIGWLFRGVVRNAAKILDK